jgi:hypothetical protein
MAKGMVATMMTRVVTGTAQTEGSPLSMKRCPRTDSTCPRLTLLIAR